MIHLIIHLISNLTNTVAEASLLFINKPITQTQAKDTSVVSLERAQKSYELKKWRERNMFVSMGGGGGGDVSVGGIIVLELLWGSSTH